MGAKNLLYGRKNRRGRTQPPRRKPQRQVEPVPRGFSPRGCKGRSPLHENNLSLPPSRREGGQGGYPSPSGKGGKNKAKGGVGGRPKQPRPPTRHRGGRASRRQRRQATPAGAANARRASAAQGHAPPAPHRAPPLFLPLPPANKKFRKSSWGFGGFFQEAPNASLPPAPLITAAASGASTMPGMPNRRKPAYMESRDRRGWMPSERPTRCGSAISRRTEEIA